MAVAPDDRPMDPVVPDTVEAPVASSTAPVVCGDAPLWSRTAPDVPLAVTFPDSTERLPDVPVATFPEDITTLPPMPPVVDAPLHG